MSNPKDHTWLTIRVQAASPGAAFAALSRFSAQEGIQVRLTEDGYNLFERRRQVGTAIIGSCSGR